MIGGDGSLLDPEPDDLYDPSEPHYRDESVHDPEADSRFKTHVHWRVRKDLAEGESHETIHARHVLSAELLTSDPAKQEHARAYVQEMTEYVDWCLTNPLTDEN